MDRTGGLMGHLFKMADNNNKNVNSSMKMALDTKKQMKDAELTNEKINYYKSEAKKNGSRYLNTSYGVFDTKTEKYIDLPKGAGKSSTNKVTESAPYGYNEDGTMKTAQQYGKESVQKAREEKKNNKKYDVKNFDKAIEAHFKI